MLHSLVITGFYGGILAVILLALSFKVIGLRKQHKIGIGDGDNAELAKAIRVHANFTEYVPISIALLAISEINGAAPWFVHAMGGLLVTCRFLHAIGLSSTIGTSWQRFAGTVGTFITLLILAIANIITIF